MNIPYDDIVEHCKSQYPKEACGLIVKMQNNYEYIPCRNSSPLELQEDEGHISAMEWSEIEDKGEVVVIVHSHPKRDASPGQTDKVSQKRHGIDWLIVGLNNNQCVDFYWLTGEKVIQPLYGREYLWQVSDCGTFIRDFYQQEFNIYIPDFYRPPEFWKTRKEIYLDCYEKAGFYDIEFKDLEYGDVILFALGTTITTHGAVYLGGNTIGHHLAGRLSCKDVLGKYYLDRATKFLRHQDRK